jgi:WD40 repeat protein
MLPTLRGHNSRVTSVAFSPDGSKIISGSYDRTIRVWDARTGAEMLPPLRGHDSSIYSVAFSPDGLKIISEEFDQTTRVWDTSTGVELPCTQTAVDDISRSRSTPVDGLIGSLKGGWFTNINTGSCLGRLPIEVDTSSYSWRVHGSTCVGWTVEHKLILIHFPAQSKFG